MAKQSSRSKNPDGFGKAKITPVQVAFIVDRYLSDNNYSETRSVFRNEASSLICKSPIQEAPKSLLSLGAMLEEYICLKEQKVMVEQEKVRLQNENYRVHALLQGMQNVMNAYNASASGSVPMIPNSTNAAKPVSAAPPAGSPPGQIMNTTPTFVPVSGPPNTMAEGGSISTPVSNYPLTRKKRGSDVAVEAPGAAKKTRSKATSRQLTNQGTYKLSKPNRVVNSQLTLQPSSVSRLSPSNCAASEATMQVSSVAKCLFDQPKLSTPPNGSSPTTPPQAVSFHSDKLITPLGASSTANGSKTNTPQEVTPPNCTIISTERVRVSPLKQMTCYTIERNHCISSCSPIKSSMKRLGKRDHVKGRLDFDGSDVIVNSDKPIDNVVSRSDSEKEADLFDLDLPNLDMFGPNFSFSELLVDLDLDCPREPTNEASRETVSGSSQESGDCDIGVNQVMSQFSSTVTEVISEKDMNAQGPESMTSVKSITKCIRIVSPAKGRRNSLEQQN